MAPPKRIDERKRSKKKAVEYKKPLNGPLVPVANAATKVGEAPGKFADTVVARIKNAADLQSGKTSILGGPTNTGTGRVIPATMGPSKPLSKPEAKEFKKKRERAAVQTAKVERVAKDKKDTKKKQKVDKKAVALWNATIEQNRLAEIERTKNNNGGGGGGAGSVASAVDRGMFDTAGRQAIDRVNSVYAGENDRTRALMATNTASNAGISQQLASGLANRYADMQRGQAATAADLAAQGFNVGDSGQGGQYQLEALQNAGNAQQAYMTQMQQMNALNESSRINDNSQARAAYESQINANVNESYNAAVVAAQEAAAKAASSGSASAPKQLIQDQRQFKYDEGIINSMFAGQPNYGAANQALDAWKGVSGPRVVAARHALRAGLRGNRRAMSPNAIGQRWGGGRQVNQMLKDVATAQGTRRTATYEDVLNYRQAGGVG